MIIFVNPIPMHSAWLIVLNCIIVLLLVGKKTNIEKIHTIKKNQINETNKLFHHHPVNNESSCEHISPGIY